MMKHKIKKILFLIICLLTVTGASLFEESSPPSLADFLHLTHPKDPVDKGWLANLTGLPTKDQIELLDRRVDDVMVNDNDPKCNAVNFNLRKMVFQHFVIYQQMVNSQGNYLNNDTAHQWGHVLAMVLKESDGNSTNVTDFNGNSLSNSYRADLQHWQDIINIANQKHVKMNYQTNFGLTQISADRLFTAFKLAQDPKYNTEFLEGRQGANTPGKVNLNTAIAIRRLIWFYQDFAQGRVMQSENRVHFRELADPKRYAKHRAGLDFALMYCGTRFLFDKEAKDEPDKLREAMASIAYCKLGNAEEGYGEKLIDEMCFAGWVTLCPALNFDIAHLTPLSYFQTRNQEPVCESTFKQLLVKAPASK